MLSINDVLWVRIPHMLVGNSAVANVGSLVKQFGGKKVLIITDAGIVEAGLVNKVTQPLEKEGISFGIFDECQPNSLISIIEKCAQKAKEEGYDFMIGLGGGSVMDTTRVSSIAATGDAVTQEEIHKLFTSVPRRGLPMIQIPTTAGTGSEVSMAALVTDDVGDGIKKLAISPWLHAHVAIIDSTMTLNMPQRITANTGWDALAHAIEGYINPKSNKVGDMFAETAIKLVADNLRDAYCMGSANVEARYNMSLAASLGMIANAIEGGPILNHGLGHSLQKVSHCTHGESCVVMLPQIMEFMLPACMHKFARIAEMMGENIEGLPLRDAAYVAIDAIKKLAMDLDLPLRLRDLGVRKEDLPEVVDVLFTINLRMVTNSPREVSREDTLNILEAAW